jgi:CBS-domain-containing membrane protein
MTSPERPEMVELSDPAQQVVHSFDALPGPDDKAAVLNHLQTANPLVIPKSDTGKLVLWKMLFALLGAVAVILAVGVVWCLIISNETAAAILIAPISAIITGMFGLFATSPTSPTP